jgi:DNA processing protein
MGTGPDQIYPKRHVELAKRIVSHGALVTEFPPGTGPMPAHFPQRNRILAGLSLAVVVVQASEKSGAAITARLALEANRELFVVAGPPWDSRFAGNRRLAREGAAVVQDGEEVVLRLGGVPLPEAAAPCPISSLRGTRRRLAERLLEGPKTADQLCRDLSSSPPEVLSLLTSLELEGVVREEPGKIYLLVDTV